MNIPSVYRRITYIAMSIVLLLSAASIVVLLVSELQNDSRNQSDKLSISGIYYTQADSAPKAIPDGGKLELPDSLNTVTFIGHFSQDIPEHTLVSLRLDNMYIKVFANDQMIFEHGKPYSVIPYVQSSGNSWQYLTSPGITTEDEIRIELQNLYSNHPVSAYQTFLQYLTIENPVTHISTYLQRYAFQWIVGGFIALIGIFQLGYAFALTRAKVDASMYYSLSGFSVFSGIWFMIDFHTLGLILPSPIAGNALQTLCVMLMVCYFLLHTATTVSGRRKVPLRINFWCTISLTLFMIFAQMTGLRDFYGFFNFINLLTIISCINILICLILEFKYTSDRFRLIPLFIILLGVFGDIIFNLIGLPYFILFEIAFIIFSCWQMYLIWKKVNDNAKEQARLHVLEKDHAQQRKLLEYQTLISQSTKGLYESIYEFDITHDCVGADTTQKLFKILGLSKDSSYSEAISSMAEQQLHESFQQEYLNLFAKDSILQSYEQGIDSLQFDFLNSVNGTDYYWLRIDARIFFWDYDQSVRMITYRQNIDSEKRREQDLRIRAEFDDLTGLLKRDALMMQMDSFISGTDDSDFIFCLLMDVDDFKQINDTLGHIAGDRALIEFAALLKRHFRSHDLISRLGGDEFMVIASMPSLDAAEAKITRFIEVLANSSMEFEGNTFKLSASIGLSFADKNSARFQTLYKESDEALYHAKKEGKNRYAL